MNSKALFNNVDVIGLGKYLPDKDSIKYDTFKNIHKHSACIESHDRLLGQIHHGNEGDSQSDRVNVLRRVLGEIINEEVLPDTFRE